MPLRVMSRLTPGLHPNEAVLHDVDAAHAMLAPGGRTGHSGSQAGRQAPSRDPRLRGHLSQAPWSNHPLDRWGN